MPLDDKARYKPMLYKYETTTRTDFNLQKFEHATRTVYKEKLARLRAAPKPLKDIETLVDKKGPMPFDLLWYPKEILRTDPRNMQQPHDKLEDEGRELARRTRPRVIISPMARLDDIEDDECRDIVLKDMYKTTTQIAMEEVLAKNEKNVRTPLPGHYSPAKPVVPLVLGKCNPPLVSPLCMDAMAWDRQQPRTFLPPKRIPGLEGDQVRLQMY